MKRTQEPSIEELLRISEVLGLQENKRRCIENLGLGGLAQAGAATQQQRLPQSIAAQLAFESSPLTMIVDALDASRMATGREMSIDDILNLTVSRQFPSSTANMLLNSLVNVDQNNEMPSAGLSVNVPDLSRPADALDSNLFDWSALAGAGGTSGGGSTSVADDFGNRHQSQDKRGGGRKSDIDDAWAMMPGNLDDMWSEGTGGSTPMESVLSDATLLHKGNMASSGFLTNDNYQWFRSDKVRDSDGTSGSARNRPAPTRPIRKAAVKAGWRKYGQKRLTNNMVRSYYRCSTPGCNVKRQVVTSSDYGGTAQMRTTGEHNHEYGPSSFDEGFTGSQSVQGSQGGSQSVQEGSQGDKKQGGRQGDTTQGGIEGCGKAEQAGIQADKGGGEEGQRVKERESQAKNEEQRGSEEGKAVQEGREGGEQQGQGDSQAEQDGQLASPPMPAGSNADATEVSADCQNSTTNLKAKSVAETESEAQVKGQQRPIKQCTLNEDSNTASASGATRTEQGRERGTETATVAEAQNCATDAEKSAAGLQAAGAEATRTKEGAGTKAAEETDDESQGDRDIDRKATSKLLESTASIPHPGVMVDAAFTKRLFDCVPAFVVTDPKANHRIVYVSQGFSDLTGYMAADSIGKKMAMLEGCAVNSSFSRNLDKALSGSTSSQVKCLFFRKDKQPFWCMVNVAPVPIPGEPGKITACVSSLFDITAKLKADC